MMRPVRVRGEGIAGRSGDAKFEDLTGLLCNTDWGNSIVWHVPSLDDYAVFVDSFILRCRDKQSRTIYLRIGSDLAAKLHHKDFLEIHEFQHMRNCPRLIESLATLIRTSGPRVSYIFDDISNHEARVSDSLVFDLFRGIRPKLREVGAISYWPLMKSSTFESTVAKFSGMAELFLSVERMDKGVCIHPLKVPSKRYYEMLRPWVFSFENTGPKNDRRYSANLELLVRKLAEADRPKHGLSNSERRYQYLVRAESYYRNIIGSSPCIRQICKMIGIAARSDATVLVLGESGTGKELVAETIHQHSSRSAGPFVKVNCAAVSETLLESELFGHRKGAFTGAIRDQKGRFRLAEGGTILLDEIGCMSLAGQAKLLRVLQEKEIEPIGESRPVKVDVRIIATTNLNVRKAISEGRFREDLFHRLNVFPIHIPPLRDRKDDISMLADYFLEKYSREIRKTIKEISAAAYYALQNYSWPGNVRELKNAIEYGVLVERDEFLQPNSLFQRIPDLPSAGPGPDSLSLKRRLEATERETILEALRRTNGVKKQAARILGIDPRNLAYYLNKHLVS